MSGKLLGDVLREKRRHFEEKECEVPHSIEKTMRACSISTAAWRVCAHVRASVYKGEISST